MYNLSTKPSACGDGFVAKLSISTNRRHETDLPVVRFTTMLCSRTWVLLTQGIILHCICYLKYTVVHGSVALDTLCGG